MNIVGIRKSTTIFLAIIVLLLVQCEKPEKVIKVATLDAISENISYTSATIQGEVIDIGDSPADDHGLLLSTNPNPGFGNADTKSLGTRSTKGMFSADFTGLTPNTDYFFKAYGTIGQNTVYGVNKQFKTPDNGTPLLSSIDIAMIGQDSAVVSFDLVSDGGLDIETVGVIWSYDAGVTVENSLDSIMFNPLLTAYEDVLRGLKCDTTFYIASFASNSKGLTYGSELTFNTLRCLGVPELTTDIVTNITETTASSGGTISYNGGFAIIEKGICWGFSPSPTISGSHTSDGSGPDAFSSNLTSLSTGSTYYVRSYATNALGTGYGDDISFITAGTAAPDIIAYYPFNNNVNDESGNGYNATNYGALPTFDRFGNANSAMYFDDAYIDSNSSLLPELGDFTLNMWIYPDSLACSLWGQYKFNIGDRIYSGIDYLSGNLFVWHSGDLDNKELISSSPLGTKEWYMITITRSGNDLELYVNGILDDTGVLSTTKILQNYHFLIGTHSPDYDLEQGFNGIIDDVKIYDGALQQGEITSLYQENGWTGKLTVSDSDGYSYDVVHIGQQLWMAENYKSTKYNDGTDIPFVISDTEWMALSTPGYCWYDNNEVANKVIYGALYNWRTVNTGILCPTGWHVPNSDEWYTLTNYLGGVEIAGGKLKESGTIHWLPPNLGATNETGFTALPGGFRFLNDASFTEQEINGYWWTSNGSVTSTAYLARINYSLNNVTIYYHDVGHGMSVRCIKD